MLETIEQATLDAFRRPGEAPLSRGSGDVSDWIGFGLRLLLDAGRRLRAARPGVGRCEVEFKSDGSPYTRLERAIEENLRERLAVFDPAAAVIGEESGGALSDAGVTVAIDPVDGTWAFLNATENFSTTLAFFRDGEPFLGMVSNPVTGEIGYARSAGPARLVQMSLFGEADSACTLPHDRPDSAPLLVNAHPSRRAGPLLSALFEDWADGGLQMVRSTGGSPALALLDAAKGGYVYVNLWSKQPAEVYDLAAGALLVQGAGGEVMDLEGRPIDMLHHDGPFIAAVDGEAGQRVAAIARRAMGA